jgi:outer membrane lipoprotein LolB
MSWRTLGIALIAVVLAACAPLRVAERDPRPFDLLGRILVAYDGSAMTGNVRWHHTADSDEIWLMTPMGQTLAHIVDTREGAVLTRADQQQYRAMSVEALTRQALGWPLPLSALQYWVRGMPVPGAPVAGAAQDEADRLVKLVQHGWQVVFTYPPDGANRRLPRRIDLTEGEKNEIRFVIDTWREVDAP